MALDERIGILPASCASLSNNRLGATEVATEAHSPAKMRQRASDDEGLPAQAVIRTARQRGGIESAHRLRATALPRRCFTNLDSWF